MSLLINTDCDKKSEIFETIQGEGLDMGVPSFFVRLQGCSVHCFFCDEKDTWVKRERSTNVLEPENILTEFEKINPLLKRVVVTGGEPTEQNLKPLFELLFKNSFTVSIETAGTGEFVYQLFENYDEDKKVKITFSPKEIYSKSSKISDDRIWKYARELKFVIANEEACDYVISRIIPKLSEHQNNAPIFLTPDWFNFDETKEMVLNLLKKYPSRFRMGAQMHKLVNMR